MERHARFPRRRLLQLTGLLPLGALLAACGGDDAEEEKRSAANIGSTSTPVPEPTATSTPEPPFIVVEGEQQRLLMEGTPQETPIHIFGSGREGPILGVLGGVHGNEPGGWLAAEQVRDALRPEAGALIVVPRANTLAVQQFVRTTDDLGDLNRLYPGDPNGQPMARMAYEITETLREFHATHAIDMHESWAFYRDRTDTATGTAFLGQTVSSSTAQGLALGRSLVEAVNGRILSPIEELTLREWPPAGFVFPTATPGGPPTPTPSADNGFSVGR
ncbi:MAG TPA: succinylglutamate desuccinylase/aspartoacylase family protein, partial [Dehalococcoidia bacterium]|nr:succinylglutamate desuccinylase/aspartoacylase family protein [Dehalococcoidia bacterium]